MAEALKDVARKVENKIPDSIKNQPIKEGELTKQIERQTAKIPSVTFLNLAFGSILLSSSLAIFSERMSWATFVGEWVPTFLLLGIYNKLVKLEGHDQFERQVS